MEGTETILKTTEAGCNGPWLLGEALSTATLVTEWVCVSTDFSRYRKGVGIIACCFHVFAVDPSDFVTPLFSLKIVMSCVDRSV